MSSDYPVNIDGRIIYVDSGIADIVQTLNDKGYRTNCCCEGHIYDCSNYARPEQRMEYGQYSPILITFRENCEPPYPPYVYKLSKEDPWKKGHAREHFGVYSPFKHGLSCGALFISFEMYKRQRKHYSDGDVVKEHDRVLDELLKWAKDLPVKDVKER